MDIANWSTILQDSFEYSFKLFMSYVPKSLGAIMLLALGILLGKIIEAGINRILNMIGVDRLLSGTGLISLLQKTGSKRSISQIIGLLSFWLVFLLFLISATDALSLALLSETLTALVHYLPKIGMATLILVLGLLATNFVRDIISVACDSSGIQQGTIIAQTVYIAATLLVIVTAINELGIDTSLLNQIIVLVIAGLIAGSALSFGFGSRSAVKNLIAAHYIQPIVRVGEKIQIGNYAGTVTAVTPMVVVLDTERGRVIIPAAQFTEVTSIIEPVEA
jgi:hypothetical protein